MIANSGQFEGKDGADDAASIVPKQPNPKGANGGGTHSRAALLLLQREVERGSELTDAQADANVRFAVAVRDDPASTRRDQLRALELLEAMRSRGVNVALYLDKADRVEAGKPTETVEHTHRVYRLEFDRAG